MNGAFNEVLEHAAHYGFTNITETCARSTADVRKGLSVLKMAANMKPDSLDINCDGYLFFDLVHPTAYAHHILAGKVQTMIEAAGLELSAQ
jgi:phospholipase/lecithinase/hemolysin